MGGKDFDISLWEETIAAEYRERESQRLKLLEETPEKLRGYFKDKKVKGVYLIGSLLVEGRFQAFSDIDVAVSGLAENYLEVLVGLEELLDRGVDLIELETCRFGKAIQVQGLQIK